MIQKERADVIQSVKQLDQAVLLPVVRKVLSDDSAIPTSGWTARPIGGSVGVGTLGIFKLSGEAKTASERKSWSVIAKVMDLSATSEHIANASPMREIHAYECGLLNQIGPPNSDGSGVRAAKHYGTHEIADLGKVLWVEDLSEAPPPPWDDATYLEIVRQIGRFNADWEINPPTEPSWFLEDLRAINHDPSLERFVTFRDYLHDPMMQLVATPTVAEQLMSLPDVVPVAHAFLDASPSSLSHLDMQPRNIFPIHLASGAIESVLIDWAEIGYRPIGTAVAGMVGSSMTWCEFDAEHGSRLLSQALLAYIEGLEENGWHGDVKLVRLAYMTSAVFRAAGNALFPVMWVNEPEWIPYMVDMLGKPPEEMVPHWRDVFEKVYSLFTNELDAVRAN